MFHTPENYLCPFCDWLLGNETDLKQNSDIVLQDNYITAFVAPKWWVNNPGHVIIIPNEHYENLYDIPDDLLGKIASASKRLAIAMRNSYDCTGTSIRQHNEPDGNQDVWHYHMHLFPRFKNDQLYQSHDNKRFVSPGERKPYADTLKSALNLSN